MPTKTHDYTFEACWHSIHQGEVKRKTYGVRFVRTRILLKKSLVVTPSSPKLELPKN